MMINTHRLVGEFLYEELPKELQCLLNRQKFVLGNMKPDFKKEYRQMSHYYRDNSVIVFKWLELVLEKNYEKEEFSEKVGILMHFLGDYTCIYHANDWIYETHSIRKHLQYEGKLHIYAVREIKKFKKNTKIIPFKNSREIYEYVKQLTDELNQESAKICIQTDLENMIQLSLSTLLYILKHKSTNN